jgi:cytochrome P450/NADPH-cytochrome P450 reductase
MPTAPQLPWKLGSHAAPAAAAPADRLLVLHGSNSGSCEAFAQRVAGEAAGQGYAAEVAALDDYVGRLPADAALVIVSASYEGQPPDNARNFLRWVEDLAPGTLSGARFAVFGCGNRQWARTYQAVPRRLDAALERAGATRLRPRGETDAGGDFFGGFDAWYEGLWADLGRAVGKAAVASKGAPSLEVEVVKAGREAALRLTDLRQATILSNCDLVDAASFQAPSRRHLEIALPAGMSYRTGDYLAVLPRNPPANVDRALRRFGLAPETLVVIRNAGGSATTLPVGYPVSVAEILSNYVELEQPATREHVNALVATAQCPPDRMALAALAHPDIYRAEILDKRVSLLGLLERHPSCDFGLAAFLSALPGMRVRQYSISSTPLRDPARCSITFTVLDAPSLAGEGRHRGVASSFLAGLSEGARLSVAVRPSQAAFRPPADPRTPLIMVCAGSGVAPFHGFLQERSIQHRSGQPVGPALLFFGVTDPGIDYLYRNELQAWEAEGVVGLRMSFSRAPEGDVRYVQHRLWQNRDEVAELFRQGATVFVCGDGERMAPAVRATFIRIWEEKLELGPDEAEAWADRLEHETGRYVADVFS